MAQFFSTNRVCRWPKTKAGHSLRRNILLIVLNTVFNYYKTYNGVFNKAQNKQSKRVYMLNKVIIACIYRGCPKKKYTAQNRYSMETTNNATMKQKLIDR